MLSDESIQYKPIPICPSPQKYDTEMGSTFMNNKNIHELWVLESP